MQLSNKANINVTAVLCVYNEIQNISIIEKNILVNLFVELIIVDGGSTDGTFEHLSKFSSVRLFRLENAGLLSQRLFGIQKATKSLVFLFNADDDISSLDVCRLVSEFSKLKADGIQVRPLARNSGNYWSGAWSEYFELLFPIHDKIPCIGRPCLMPKMLFDGIVVNQNIFNEDTYLKYEQELRHGELSCFSSEQVVFREMPKGLRINVRQFIRYGQSDAVITKNNIYKLFHLLYHSLFRILLIRTIRLCLRGKFKFSLFTILMGLSRGVALLYYNLKK